MYGVKREVKLGYASYRNNGTLALQLYCKPEGEDMEYYRGDPQFEKDPFVETYGVATVNLPESAILPAGSQFIDENNLPGIGKWLKENGIAKPVGAAARSGYCTYQAYAFNVPEKKLAEITAERRKCNTLPPHGRSEGQRMR